METLLWYPPPLVSYQSQESKVSREGRCDGGEIKGGGLVCYVKIIVTYIPGEIEHVVNSSSKKCKRP